MTATQLAPVPQESDDRDGVSKPRPLPISVPARADAAWPEQQDGRSRRTMRLLLLSVLVSGAVYLTWRLLATISPVSAAVGIPLLALEAWSFAALGLRAFRLWDVDAISRPEPVAETDQRVVVLIPTFDEPHQVLMPTLAAATRMRLASQIIVLDDGHREWLAGMCDELGIEYRTRLGRRDGLAGQLNAVIGTLDADYVLVLDADQVVDRDFIGHTLPHFDDAHVALVQTPRETYTATSFEHVAKGRERFAERTIMERMLGAGSNRWNGAAWTGGGALIRLAALDAVAGVATGTSAETLDTTVNLHRGGWRTVHHNEVLARGSGAADAGQYAADRSREAAGSLQVLRRQRFLAGRGLTMRQRIGHLALLASPLDAWRILGYLLLPAVALLLLLTPATGPVALFVILFPVALVLRRVAAQRLCRGQGHPATATLFDILRMAATLGATSSLLTGRAARGGRKTARITAALLWGLTVLNAAATLWAVGVLAGWTSVAFDYPAIAAGAAIWTALNTVFLIRAVGRVRSPEFVADRRQAHRIEVEGHVYLDGQRVHVLDLSLTGVRLLTYGDVPDVDAYCTMTFTDPNKRPAVVTGTVVGLERRPHGHEIRIDLESDQTYVLGAILAEALVR